MEISGVEPSDQRSAERSVRGQRHDSAALVAKQKQLAQKCELFLFGGDKRDRTADLLNAIQALSQLSYTPISGDALNYTIFIAACQGKFLNTDKKGILKIIENFSCFFRKKD